MTLSITLLLPVIIILCVEVNGLPLWSSNAIRKARQFFYYHHYPVEPWLPGSIGDPVFYKIPQLPEFPTFIGTDQNPLTIETDEINPMFRSSLRSKFSKPNKLTSQLNKDDRETLNLATSLVNNYIKVRRAGLALNPQMAQLFKDIHLPASLFKNGNPNNPSPDDWKTEAELRQGGGLQALIQSIFTRLQNCEGAFAAILPRCIIRNILIQLGIITTTSVPTDTPTTQVIVTFPPGTLPTTTSVAPATITTSTTASTTSTSTTESTTTEQTRVPTDDSSTVTTTTVQTTEDDTSSTPTTTSTTEANTGGTMKTTTISTTTEDSSDATEENTTTSTTTEDSSVATDKTTTTSTTTEDYSDATEENTTTSTTTEDSSDATDKTTTTSTTTEDSSDATDKTTTTSTTTEDSSDATDKTTTTTSTTTEDSSDATEENTTTSTTDDSSDATDENTTASTTTDDSSDSTEENTTTWTTDDYTDYSTVFVGKNLDLKTTIESTSTTQQNITLLAALNETTTTPNVFSTTPKLTIEKLDQAIVLFSTGKELFPKKPEGLFQKIKHLFII